MVERNLTTHDKDMVNDQMINYQMINDQMINCQIINDHHIPQPYQVEERSLTT